MILNSDKVKIVMILNSDKVKETIGALTYPNFDPDNITLTFYPRHFCQQV